MNIKDLAKSVHRTARRKGWWDKPREDGTLLMLMVSELAEAMEEIRAGKPMIYGNFKDIIVDEEQVRLNNLKPEGAAVEVVDCLIRILDWTEHNGIDIESVIKLKADYNTTRSRMHGGKKF